VVCVAIAGITLLAAPLVTAASVPFCFYRMITGLPCLFCGMTRALASAVHGEWSAAAAANPLWWAIFPLVVGAAGMLITRRARLGLLAVAIVVGGTIARDLLLVGALPM
jgi:Protein of unknown function (DUF2752)